MSTHLYSMSVRIRRSVILNFTWLLTVSFKSSSSVLKSPVYTTSTWPITISKTSFFLWAPCNFINYCTLCERRSIGLSIWRRMITHRNHNGNPTSRRMQMRCKHTNLIMIMFHEFQRVCGYKTTCARLLLEQSELLIKNKHEISSSWNNTIYICLLT